MQPLSMVSVSGPPTDPQSLGFYPYIQTRGWEAAFAERPHGASDCPSADETIAAGCGLCLNRPFGWFYAGQAHVAGYEHLTGRPVRCDPRGPGCFARFNDLFKGGLEEFCASARTRTDECRRRGNESAMYVGMPALDAFGPQTADKIVRRILEAWTDPILRAGFDRVQIDASALTAQTPGRETPTMRWAEHMLYEGLAVDVETIEVVTPTAFPWFNGRFGCVASPESREFRAAPGWFNRSCSGCSTRRFLWLQGSIPPIQRVTMLQTELASPSGDDVIMDFAGCWTKTWA